MLRAFVQYTLNVDLNAPVIKDLVEKYKDIEQFNPNRSLEKVSCHFLMTAIRKTALYMLDL